MGPNFLHISGYETLDKQMNGVSFSSLDMSPDMFNPGHLISLICHRGDVNTGHFVSYHLVDDTWFLNDDNREALQVENPLTIPYDDTVLLNSWYLRKIVN